MHAHEKIEVKNLTKARRVMNATVELRPELPIATRAERVAEYARQVAAYGEIVAYMPITEPRTPVRRRSRFVFGDALRPRR